MLKRAHGSAFPSSAPSRGLVSATGMQSPPLPSSFLPLHVPGQWPLDEGCAPQCDEPPVDHSSTLFTTIGKWVAIVADISTLSNLPHYLARTLLRRQKIAIVPVLRGDGSCKKRLLDAGIATEPRRHSLSPRERLRIKSTQRRSRQSSQGAHLDPWHYSRNLGQSPGRHIAEPSFDDPKGDDGLDFSFSETLASNLLQPPFHHTLPPSNTIHFESRTGQTTPDSTARKVKPSGDKSRASPSRIPSNSQTPKHVLRRRLLKFQLRASSELQEGQEQSFPGPDSVPSVQAEPHTSPSNMPVGAPSSLLLNTSSSSMGTDTEPSLSECHTSTQSSESEPPSPSLVETDLSFLSEENSISPDKVRRTQHAGKRLFYFDEKAGKMLDSTLQAVTSTPVKDIKSDHEEREKNTSRSHFRAAKTYNSDSDDDEFKADDGARNVPEHSSEESDDSIDELQLSTELLESLQEDLNQKLALAPPPPPPLKPLVAPLSANELEQLASLAEETDHGRNAGYYIVPEKIQARDFGTLLPDRFNGDPKAWLNDNIVNEYLAILIAHKKKEAGFTQKRGGPAPPIHAFSSFWYNTASTRPKGVERWASRFQLGGHQYLEANLILYPICDGGHWRLLVIKPKERVIEYFDSLGFGGDKYIKTFKEYIKKELGDAWAEEEWTVMEKQRSSRQLNGSDCGVFTILNALVMLREEEAPRVVATCGMPEARERIAITLMAGQATTEWD